MSTGGGDPLKATGACRVNGLQQLRQELCSVPILGGPASPHPAGPGRVAVRVHGCLCSRWVWNPGRCSPGVNQISAQAIRTFWDLIGKILKGKWALMF